MGKKSTHTKKYRGPTDAQLKKELALRIQANGEHYIENPTKFRIDDSYVRAQLLRMRTVSVEQLDNALTSTVGCAIVVARSILEDEDMPADTRLKAAESVIKIGNYIESRKGNTKQKGGITVVNDIPEAKLKPSSSMKDAEYRDVSPVMEVEDYGDTPE